MSVCLAVEREENSDHVDHCHGDILSISDVITGIGRSVRLHGGYILGQIGHWEQRSHKI